MDRREYFVLLEGVHLKLWLLEKHLRQGDAFAERLYREYLELLRELLERAQEFYP